MRSVMIWCMPLLLLANAAPTAKPANMLPGMKYILSNPAPGAEGQTREFASSEYFEVDSTTMKFKYSEVIWRTLPAVDLPSEIVQRFANKTMAVTGFEVDLLRTVNGKTESVPAYESYNHHYGVSLISKAAKLKLDENGLATGPDMGHGKILEFESDDAYTAPPDARLAQSFIHGNGQEHRQIFHGAPKGYAQPIYSPGQFVFTPMQIGTNDGTGQKGVRSWQLPKIKRDAAPAQTAYSPILECPCTTRVHINGTAGTINGGAFNGDCEGRHEPLSDLLDNKNPTCWASTYVGGLSCCGDGEFLLDADQEPPAFVDEVFVRFRFYFEEYDAAKHQDINHVEWASNGCDSGCGGKCPNGCRHIEYDVVKGVGSKYGSDVQVFQSTFPAGDMLAASCTPKDGQCMDTRTVDPKKGFKLIMAAAHCHAPNCIRQELINKDSGEVLCNGTTKLGQSEANYDEAGYLYTPPCLWGATEDGLMAPPVLFKNTTLQMVTYFNSTWGHPGQMGIWQMKAAVVV